MNEIAEASPTKTSAAGWLAAPWIAAASVIIAIALTCGSLANGLEADDYYHRSVLVGSPRFDAQLRGPQAMFRFMPGDPQHAQALMDAGFLPWWTDTGIKFELFQLIPTQTHILDYSLWPRSPALMHAQSLAWFAALVFLTARFYRRVLGPTWMAGAAALLFAVEDTHGTPVGWICNRNVLIAATFGMAALIAHDCWRREGRRWGLPVALILWLLSLCSKEAGIATCAYLFAYAAWLDESSLVRRVLTLVPYGVVLVGWRLVRDALGYGVENIGFYVDPITNPPQFLYAMAERFPIFLMGQGGLPSDLTGLLNIDPLLGSWWWWLAAIHLVLVLLMAAPLLRSDPVARFFATGMLLSTIPICATFPMDRLLMFVGVGALGLIVRFWNAAFFESEFRPQATWWRVAAKPVGLALILMHVVIAPPLLAARAMAPLGPREMLKPLYLETRFDEAVEDQDLVVINAPVPMAAGYCLMNFEYEGMPSPRALRALAPGMSPVRVKRLDAHTLEVEPEAGYLRFPERLIRSKRRALRVGQPCRVARMTATVVRKEQGRPKVVTFRFDSPLDDASMRWMRFRGGDYESWKPPAIGSEVILRPEWGPDTW